MRKNTTILHKIYAVSVLVVFIFVSCVTKQIATPSTNLTATPSANLTATPSANLEDYVTGMGTYGKFHYTLANYDKMEKWFVKQATGKSDVEIVALYDSLPLIREIDNFDHMTPEKKQEYILKLARPIIAEDSGYKQVYTAFLQYSEKALQKTMEFFGDKFPELEADITLVINPFFPNGGMGIAKFLPNGKAEGRLEIGPGRLADSKLNKQGIEIWIAHEMTHIIHQLLGAKIIAALKDPEDLKKISPVYLQKMEDAGGLASFENINLLSEGLAVYTSALINNLNHDDHISDLYFSEEYAQGPIYEQGFERDLASNWRDSYSKLDSEFFPFEFHSSWFSSHASPEERPVPEYTSLGYFLGYHVVNTLVNEGDSWEAIINSNCFDMIVKISNALEILSKG